MTLLIAQGSLRWTQAFIGIPHVDLGRDFKGIDCVGLAQLVYRDRAGIELPAFASGYLDGPERREVDAIIAGAPSPLWRLVSTDIEARDLNELDIAAFRSAPYDIHIGIALRPGLMLHAARGDCSKIESYWTPLWRSRCLGFWRHVDLAGKAVPA
jgi:cell wall-associated NlpC family hydrolase